MQTIDIALQELERLFQAFNEKYYDLELVQPVIVIQHQGKRKDILGWCTTKEIWINKEKTEKRYEITICAEYLHRSIEEIAGTMLHEMVHLDNITHGVKDCTRSGKYHNKKFKASAEHVGLIVELSDIYGYSHTELNQANIDFVKSLSLDMSGFKLSRSFQMKKPCGKKSSMRKYVCPECQMAVRATKEVNVLCGDCNLSLLEE
jgi:hypothetical protein